MASHSDQDSSSTCPTTITINLVVLRDGSLEVDGQANVHAFSIESVQRTLAGYIRSTGFADLAD